MVHQGKTEVTAAVGGFLGSRREPGCGTKGGQAAIVL